MWDSGIGRVRGQQTSSVIEVCEVWVFLQACIFPLKFLMSVPASPSTKCSWKRTELETKTSHNIAEKAHKDNIHMKPARQEKEACVQSKAVKLGKA